MAFGRDSLKRFLKRLNLALDRVNAEMEGGARDKFSRGLSSEGWHGGYAEALRDVDAMLRHGSPSGRGQKYWRANPDSQA
jgi:hypothetical protein